MFYNIVLDGEQVGNAADFTRLIEISDTSDAFRKILRQRKSSFTPRNSPVKYSIEYKEDSIHVTTKELPPKIVYEEQSFYSLGALENT